MYASIHLLKIFIFIFTGLNCSLWSPGTLAQEPDMVGQRLRSRSHCVGWRPVFNWGSFITPQCLSITV